MPANSTPANEYHPERCPLLTAWIRIGLAHGRTYRDVEGRRLLSEHEVLEALVRDHQVRSIRARPERSCRDS